MYFVDTAALVQAYITDRGTGAVLHAYNVLSGSSLCVSRLVVSEAAAVFAKKLRTKAISRREYDQIKGDLKHDLKTRFYLAEIESHTFQRSLVLIDRHRDRGVGAADMIHVATAEDLQTTFPSRIVGIMTSDGPLKTVAMERGLPVFDPETDPVSSLLPPD